MPCDGFLFLHISRSGIKLRFHDTEGFLDPPEVMVGSIDFRSAHMDLRSYNHVISGQFLCVFYCLFIYLDLDFSSRFCSFLICRNKGNILGTVSIFRFFCFTRPEFFCFFHLSVNFIYLLFRKLRVKGHNTLFCKL